MATKTITNQFRFKTETESEKLIDALDKASKMQGKKICISKKYEEIKGHQVNKYASKFAKSVFGI